MDMTAQNIGDLAVSQALGAKPLAAPSAMANIDKTAQDFESVFISQMFQPMFDSVKVNDTFGGGHGEEAMRSFLTQEFGKLAAKHGGFGLAKSIKADMIRMQAAANAKKGTAGVMSSITPRQAAASYTAKGA